MNDAIKETLAVLPNAPGVYIMHDASGKVIYVDGDDLYVLFESAAYGYRYTSLTQFDRILKLNLNTLLTNSTN